MLIMLGLQVANLALGKQLATLRRRFDNDMVDPILCNRDIT